MRRFAMVGLILLAAIPAIAQEQAPPPEAVLHEILGLDDAQISALHQLEHARQMAVTPLLPQIGQAQEAVAAALNAATPDPTTVGNALLNVRALQSQVDQAQKTFTEGFMGLLTDAQRQQVQQIRGVETALRAAQALHAIGL